MRRKSWPAPKTVDSSWAMGDGQGQAAFGLSPTLAAVMFALARPRCIPQGRSRTSLWGLCVRPTGTGGSLKTKAKSLSFPIISGDRVFDVTVLLAGN
jgi:hypothetical protein